MRLIDADKFKDGFNTDTAIGKTMRLMIDEQQIAYDVDKVIQKIEELQVKIKDKSLAVKDVQSIRNGKVDGIKISLEKLNEGLI